MLFKTGFLTTFFFLTFSVSLTAQDQFGQSVAVGDNEIFVLKPSVGRGPATVYVYRPADDGTWQEAQRLFSSKGPSASEGFSPSMALTGGTLLVGSADPEVVEATHIFRRGSSAWAAANVVPLRMESSATPAESATLDMAGLMRIMQPPSRVVAANSDYAAVAVVSGPVANRGINVMERTASGWASLVALEVSGVGSNDRLGAAMAMQDGRLLVGAPGRGASGAVFVFARDAATGSWIQQAELKPDSSTEAKGFGTSVAFDGDAILVGAPASQRVLIFSGNDVTGEWRLQNQLMPIDPDAAANFGAEIAVSGNHLWVGVPGADSSRGGIDRFSRGTSESEWHAVDALRFEDLHPRSAFGVSIALGSETAVVGAPGPRGQAAVFSREGDGWSDPTWLTMGGDLEMVAGEEVSCAEGRAGGFDCDNVDLLAFLPITSLGGGVDEGVSDVWGWTDPETGHEYALVGRSRGAAFVDITNPTAPVYVGLVPANRSGARDLKVFQDHLFFTGDGAGAHGLLVFDLTRLRDVQGTPVTFEPDAKYDGIASAHNLILDPDAGFAYPVGASGGGETCGGGLHMVDIREPANPTFAGCYTDTEGLIYAGRTHDGQCVVYRGPDQDYQGRQICFASNETALRIVDVTDKDNPTPISAASYPGIAYVHQGWLTEDQRYFYLDDELDELVNTTDRTRTLVWDVAELDDPVLVGEYFGPDGATDHNLFVKGNRMYQANYQAGFRVVDISDPENPVEVGHFDTTPYEGNPAGFNGAWTAFPFFESGTVIVSSMNEGLFILKPRPPVLVP